MIRINLLPQKRTQVRGAPPPASQKWLLVVLGAVVIEIIGLFFFHRGKLDDLDAQNKKNQAIQAQIDDIKAKVKNHEDIKKQLAVLRAREDAIAKLQVGRTGPTAVLLEVAQLLTPGKGPTVDQERLNQLKKDNPLAVYNPGWDSRRVWLTGYLESERNVRIEGLARDAADVSELAQRLKLSVYFYDVQILPGKKEIDQKTKMELIAFALQLKVRY